MSRGKECKKWELEKKVSFIFFATHYFKDHIFHTYLATTEICEQLKINERESNNGA